MIHSIQEIVDYSNGIDTKLNKKAIELPGHSSFKVRNLLNKTVSYPNTKYLEIGVWLGSTFYSALINNSPEYAFAIDNFSLEVDQKENFIKNISDVNVDYTLIDSDCFSLEKHLLLNNKFNVYFYDGGHSFSDQENALTYYYEHLEDTFIYICDDYNWKQVQEGTSSGISKCNLKILEEQQLLSSRGGDTEGFWNGIYIAKLQKQIV